MIRAAVALGSDFMYRLLNTLADHRSKDSALAAQFAGLAISAPAVIPALRIAGGLHALGVLAAMPWAG
jgi:hypothetical protein